MLHCVHCVTLRYVANTRDESFTGCVGVVLLDTWLALAPLQVSRQSGAGNIALRGYAAAGAVMEHVDAAGGAARWTESWGGCYEGLPRSCLTCRRQEDAHGGHSGTVPVIQC